jgi:O-antigen biosynthesis protein
MRNLRSYYYRWRDKLLPLGTRRRLALIIVLEATVKERRLLSVRNITAFCRDIYFFFRDRRILDERLRGQLSDRVCPMVSLAVPFSSTGQAQSVDTEALNFPSHSDPMVSVVMPVLNNWVLTAQCLSSLSVVSEDVPFEIIVVDNGSSDETTERLQRIVHVRSIRNETNIGFVGACNQGARAARGRYILFLNNDTVVTAGFLRSMVDLARQDRRVGLVGAKLVYPDGRLQEAGGIVWNDSVHIAWNFGRYDSPAKPEYNYVKEVDYCSGACLLARKDILESVGFFDELYSPAYCEDTDLAFSVRAAGYKVVYQPKAIVFHLEGATAGNDVGTGLKHYQEINRKKFFEKWKPTLISQHFDCGQHLFLARDRSRFKPVMLYMDHQVPAFDRDAGSLITFQYLRLFVDLGLKIVFWPDNLQNPEPYTSTLQHIGIEVIYGYANFQTYMKRFGRYFDYIVLSRPLFSLRYIDTAKKYATKGRILYVAHDLHFLREARRAQTEGSHRLAGYAKRLKAKELGVMKKSDATLVFSEFEKQIVAAEDPGITVEVMPWIQEAQRIEMQFNDRMDIFFLGSFVHKPNIDGLLWFVREIWPSVSIRLPNVKLIVAGNGPTEEVLALNGPKILVKGYVPDTYPCFQNSKVFIAPLRFGAGVKGKIVESMSHGLPVVTTPIGVEGLNLENGENVFVADSPDDFSEKIFRLFDDEALWQRLSSGGLEFVKKSFSRENGLTFCRDILGLRSRQ